VFGFAIDDFGMGYSNLGRLKALAFETLKIDRSLITGVGEDPASESLVHTILDMAKAIDAHVVAEGSKLPSS
jgi:EAL domain-containing protein (putative c-di-GMP-specific phosphodiesterase class I)